MIRKGWTAYATALTGLMLAGEALKLAQGVPFDFRALANGFITGVLLVSLWGYALRRRIGAQYYWRAACWVVAGATLLAAGQAALAGDAARYVVVVSLALLLPAFYASYRYAYRSPEIWPPQEVAP
jgi:hypothetical protein